MEKQEEYKTEEAEKVFAYAERTAPDLVRDVDLSFELYEKLMGTVYEFLDDCNNQEIPISQFIFAVAIGNVAIKLGTAFGVANERGLAHE